MLSDLDNVLTSSSNLCQTQSTDNHQPITTNHSYIHDIGVDPAFIT